MLEEYCKDNGRLTIEYEHLIVIIEKLDTVIDIWNHPLNKNFKTDENNDIDTKQLTRKIIILLIILNMFFSGSVLWKAWSKVVASDPN